MPFVERLVLFRRQARLPNLVEDDRQGPLGALQQGREREVEADPLQLAAGAARLLLAEILKLEGHEVASASEPAEGMRLSRKFAPDLVILDYHMPGNTGAHLFESLRRNNATKSTPILFMSGEASPEQILSEISDTAGARFLPKPVPLADFRAAVGEMLADKKTEKKKEV